MAQVISCHNIDSACSPGHDLTPCQIGSIFAHEARSHFLSLAWSKLKLCSANHRAGYFSNLPCDWLSIAQLTLSKRQKWALDIMAAGLQMALWDAFYDKDTFQIPLNFLRVQLRISLSWFRWWLGAKLTTCKPSPVSMTQFNDCWKTVSCYRFHRAWWIMNRCLHLVKQMAMGCFFSHSDYSLVWCQFLLIWKNLTLGSLIHALYWKHKLWKHFDHFELSQSSVKSRNGCSFLLAQCWPIPPMVCISMRPLSEALTS